MFYSILEFKKLLPLQNLLSQDNLSNQIFFSTLKINYEIYINDWTKSGSEKLAISYV